MSSQRAFSAKCLLHLLTLLVIITITVYYFPNWSRLLPENNVANLRYNISYEQLLNQTTSNSSQACILPNLDPFSPKMLTYFHKVPPVICDWRQDFVTASPDGSVLSITRWAEETHGPLTCRWSDVIRTGGDFIQHVTSVFVKEAKVYVLKNSDFVLVTCIKADGTVWKNVVAGLRQNLSTSLIMEKPYNLDHMVDLFKIKHNQEALQNLEKMGYQLPNQGSSSLPLNVVILGFDSLSRQNFRRTLPNIVSWLQKNDAVILTNYNVLGLGTIDNHAALLTGIKFSDWPEVRLGRNGTHNMDVMPFIWTDYKQKGYITSMIEDTPGQGAFTGTGRWTGFVKQPTDHYMRTFFWGQIKLIDGQTKQNNGYLCYKGTPHYMIHFDHIRQLYTKYPKTPKFVMDWHGEICHDDMNLAQVADNDTVNLLEDLKTNGYLNDTLLIVMSDHGPRFGKVMQTVEGKMENKMPFMSFHFPQQFKIKFPQAFENLLNNRERLTSALDIHATLKHLLSLEKDVNNTNINVTQVQHQGLSVLRPIPSSRDCASAGISTRWCACLHWRHLPTDTPFIQVAAVHLLDHINNMTTNHRDICAKFTLDQVTRASIMVPSKGSLKNEKLSYYNTDAWLQVEVVLEPGHARFDATFQYENNQLIFESDGRAVSRISKYEGQADCIQDGDLRPWCFCK